MEIIFGIIGLLIAGLTFYYSYHKEPAEELNHLKAQFRANQKLSKSTQKAIQEFAENNNKWDSLIFPNMTFREYLQMTENSYEENLSDSLYEKISKTKLSKANISSMTRSLEQQYTSLQEMSNKMKMLSMKSEI